MSHDPMTPLSVTSWYVSRRVLVPHTDATRALGEALRAGEIARGAPADVAVDDVWHSRPGEARGFTGRLRLGPVLGAIRVEVEVEPWSRSESALAVRPFRRPPTYRSVPYFRRVDALLDGLEGCVLERVTIAPEGTEIRRAS